MEGPLKKVKPAVYQGKGHWGWALLRELAEMVNRPPKEVIRDFLELSQTIDKRFLEVALPSGEVLFCHPVSIYGGHTIDKRTTSGDIFVPTGWALDVLKVHALGAVRVTAIVHRHERGKECQLRTVLPCVQTGHGLAHGVLDFIGYMGYDPSGEVVVPNEKEGKSAA